MVLRPAALPPILISCGIAYFEYCLQVPANRIGFTSGRFDGYQLKIIQEVIILVVFIGFAAPVLKERPSGNLVSFGLMALAVYFAMGFRPAGGRPRGVDDFAKVRRV